MLGSRSTKMETVSNYNMGREGGCQEEALQFFSEQFSDVKIKTLS